MKKQNPDTDLLKLIANKILDAYAVKVAIEIEIAQIRLGAKPQDHKSEDYRNGMSVGIGVAISNVLSAIETAEGKRSDGIVAHIRQVMAKMDEVDPGIDLTQAIEKSSITNWIDDTGSKYKL